MEVITEIKLDSITLVASNLNWAMESKYSEEENNWYVGIPSSQSNLQNYKINTLLEEVKESKSRHPIAIFNDKK